MEYTVLCKKIEEKIAKCREKYERDREDPFWSHTRSSELNRMETFYESIRKEGMSAVRLSDLKDRLAELEKEKKREEEYPSFDWYGEHYHYLVLEGQCDAYRSMIELLEENENEQEVTKSSEQSRRDNMILDFRTMEETVLPNFKGGEKQMAAKMFADEKNRIMLSRLVPGASVGLHTHEGSSEIVYILEGGGKVLYDGAEMRIKAGQAHYCPEGHEHSLINDTESDLVFFAVVPQQ